MPTNAKNWMLIRAGLYLDPTRNTETGVKEYAPRFTEKEARELSPPEQRNSPYGVRMIHETHAPDYAPNCDKHIQAQHAESRTIRGYQRRVAIWIGKCFIGRDKETRAERGWRFIEEALELAQSLGMSRDDVNKVAERVFSRPAGDTQQEAAQSFLTLASLCWAQDIDLQGIAFEEIERVEMPAVIAQIRDSQAEKHAAGLGG